MNKFLSFIKPITQAIHHWLQYWLGMVACCSSLVTESLDAKHRMYIGLP